LSGDFGEDAQRVALGELTSSIPADHSLLTSRQKFVAIVVLVLFVAMIVSLVAVRLALPAYLARKAVGS
jgi:hypothetical protein